MKYFLFLLSICLCVPVLADRLQVEDTVVHRTQTQEEKGKGQSPEEEKGSETKSDFTSSWKFYFIILAFPVILIVIFILVFIRGKRG